MPPPQNGEEAWLFREVWQAGVALWQTTVIYRGEDSVNSRDGCG